MSEFPPLEPLPAAERPDPGTGWRQRLERRLLSRPARLFHLRVTAERARLERLARGSSPDPFAMRCALRRHGVVTEALTSWCALALERGTSPEAVAGALGLLRGTSIQCGKPELVPPMVGLACQALALAGRRVHLIADDGDAVIPALKDALQSALAPFDLAPVQITPDSSRLIRRQAYAAPVTLVSAREALRDYLGHRLDTNGVPGDIARRLGDLAGRPGPGTCMQGLPFAIVLDAGEVLIERACEPLSLASSTDSEREYDWAETVLHLAGELTAGLHYEPTSGTGLALTDAGQLKLEVLRRGLSGPWCNRRRSERDVLLGLRALLLERGLEYGLGDAAIELPGSLAAEEGLLQLLQLKEGLPVSGRAIVRGRLTCQRFFRRYRELAAVSASTRFIRDELWQIYGLPDYPLTGTAAVGSPVPDEHDECPPGATERYSGRAARAARASLRHWRGYRARHRARLRRAALLRLDDRAGTLTSFFGRSE